MLAEIKELYKNYSTVYKSKLAVISKRVAGLRTIGIFT
jgi:hypothetical protein